jgi:hypothetical protein
LNKIKTRQTIQKLLNKSKAATQKGDNKKADQYAEDAYRLSLWLHDKAGF